MFSLKNDLSACVAQAFLQAGYADKFGEVQYSDRPDISQFQCNGALAAAKHYKKNPKDIAAQVVALLQQQPQFAQVFVAGAGFINLICRDEFLAQQLKRLTEHEFSALKTSRPCKIVMDYGGPNIAKPMHVGHLRSAIIGESLKRLARFLGHQVWADVHLGDWGLQMGMVIAELKVRYPELCYFQADSLHDSLALQKNPMEDLISLELLESIYPVASQKSKIDPEFLEQAREMTHQLQAGHAGYSRLWRHFVDISIAGLKQDYQGLDVTFDLWYGESYAHAYIADLVKDLQARGIAYASEGAWVIDVQTDQDSAPLPPLILLKSDGAVLYSTTDLATIWQRQQDFQPDFIWYVVDNRQADHFKQVFRAAHKAAIVPVTLSLEHIGFGTMNSSDGKPFKTRAGGVMKLRDLLAMMMNKAMEKMDSMELSQTYAESEKKQIAAMVAIAALKFGDLVNHRTKDYVFDLDKFTSFEGRTGPYVIYSAVRAHSILSKAHAEVFDIQEVLMAPASAQERILWIKLLQYADVLLSTFEHRAPNILCEYLYELASVFNQFYRDHIILKENNIAQRGSWLRLVQMFLAVMSHGLGLLGIKIPARM